MAPSSFELEKLIQAAIANTISNKDAKRLREALAPKFVEGKYNNKKEQILVSAYGLYPNNPELRKRYIDKAMEQWRVDVLGS